MMAKGVRLGFRLGETLTGVHLGMRSSGNGAMSPAGCTYRLVRCTTSNSVLTSNGVASGTLGARTTTDDGMATPTIARSGGTIFCSCTGD